MPSRCTHTAVPGFLELLPSRLPTAPVSASYRRRGNPFRGCIVYFMLRPASLLSPPDWLRRDEVICASPRLLRYIVTPASSVLRRRMTLGVKLDGRTGNLPSSGLSPDKSRQLVRLHNNHAHILLCSGALGLAKFMRRLLTGYAVSYNLRHRRHGHVFQNRYKSIVCDGDSYFTELVRYIHLNPLRVELVKDLKELERYPYCGHGTILGTPARQWQDCESVLAQFGRRAFDAKQAYRRFVAEGVTLGRRPELVGGGLARSAGEWFAVRSQRPRKAGQLSDERILGSGEFVEHILRESDARAVRQHAARRGNRYAGACRGRGMQEERSIANGTPKRESSGPVACGENEDSLRARGELRRRGRRGRPPSGNLDLWGFEDPNENFVQLVNSVPTPSPHLEWTTAGYPD